jgi:hypothetical protein
LAFRVSPWAGGTKRPAEGVRHSPGRLLQEADDQGEEGPDDRRQGTGAERAVGAADELGDRWDEHRQHLAAEPAADEAEDGVEHRAEVPVLEHRADDVAADAAGDEAHDPTDDLGIHCVSGFLV